MNMGPALVLDPPLVFDRPGESFIERVVNRFVNKEYDMEFEADLDALKQLELIELELIRVARLVVRRASELKRLADASGAVIVGRVRRVLERVWLPDPASNFGTVPSYLQEFRRHVKLRDAQSGCRLSRSLLAAAIYQWLLAGYDSTTRAVFREVIETLAGGAKELADQCPEKADPDSSISTYLKNIGHRAEFLAELAAELAGMASHVDPVAVVHKFACGQLERIAEAIAVEEREEQTQLREIAGSIARLQEGGTRMLALMGGNA